MSRGKRSRGVCYGGIVKVCILALVCLIGAGAFLLRSRQAADPPAPPEAGSDTPEKSGGVPEPVPEPEPDELEPEPDPRQVAVETLLSSMSLEEKVGQMFFARCPDLAAAEKISQFHLGGYLLFTKDFKDSAGQWLSKEDFTAKIASYQAASSIPMLIGADEEGGTVARASRNPNLFPEKFPSPQKVYAKGAATDPDNAFQSGMEEIRRVEAEKNTGLRSYGINVNFAPVADVSTDPGDFMNDRTFGQDAEKTAQFVSMTVQEMSNAQVGAVLKHFPGYGNNADTHTGIAVDERPYEQFEQTDFVPFRAGIEAGAGSVLVSHNIVSCMDGTLPASLSGKVHGILRYVLGFTGVVLTDDLAMDAVKAYAADGSVAVLAVQAGNDMIVTSDFETQISQVIEAVNAGTIREGAIDAAVTRVLSWKYDLGLLDNSIEG